MQIVRELNHRNILGFLAIKDFRDTLPFVVFTTEFAAGGDLLCKIKKLVCILITLDNNINNY